MSRKYIDFNKWATVVRDADGEGGCAHLCGGWGSGGTLCFPNFAGPKTALKVYFFKKKYGVYAHVSG